MKMKMILSMGFGVLMLSPVVSSWAWSQSQPLSLPPLPPSVSGSGSGSGYVPGVTAAPAAVASPAPSQLYVRQPVSNNPNNASSFGIMEDAFNGNAYPPVTDQPATPENPAYTESSAQNSAATPSVAPSRDPSRPSKPPMSIVPGKEGSADTFGSESENMTGLDPVEEARSSWEFDPQQRIRQSGQRIEQPDHRGFYYARSSADRSLLQRWVTQLVSEGVSESKVLFEAKRLNKADFERWASKIIWAEEDLHPNYIEISNY